VFSHEDGMIQLQNAIGYRGTKTYEGQEHTLFVVHGLFRDRGYVVVCDTTTSVLPKAQCEIEAVLRSWKHTDAPRAALRAPPRLAGARATSPSSSRRSR
jgi:hypothetical protein